MPKRNIEKNKKLNNCGQRFGILCTEFFLQEYNPARIKYIILYLYKTQYNRFKALFNAWPKEKEGGTFIEKRFLETRSEALFQEIYEEIKKTEENKHADGEDYILYNFKGMIKTKAISFLVHERKLVEFEREIAVIKLLDHLIIYTEIQLTLEDLERYVNEPDTKQSKDLSKKLGKIPGLGNARYVIRKSKNSQTGITKETVKIIVKERNFEQFYEYIMYGREKSTGIRVKPKKVKQEDLYDNDPSPNKTLKF